jgi:FkbH-like protein
MVSLIEILKDNAIHKDSHHTIKLLYISNVVMVPIEEILAYNLRLLGIECSITTGLYNSPITSMKNHANEYDILVINIDPFYQVVNENFTNNAFTNNQIQQLETNYTELINQVLASNELGKPIIIVGLTEPVSLAKKTYHLDVKSSVESCNKYIESLKSDNIEIFDLKKLVSLLSYKDAFNENPSEILPSQYHTIFIKYFGEMLAIYAGKLLLPYKKILIFDCDNTLWNGVIAESDYDLVNQNEALFEEKTFFELQNFAKELEMKGILLALCSKNNESTIFSVFEKNTNMPLSLDSFIATRINWNQKSVNILSICEELNIAPDSAVFVDDSLFEIKEVLSAEKLISCLMAPENQIELNFFVWKMSLLFLSKSNTQEDIIKSRLYRENKEREKNKRKFETYDDYLKSLNTKINLSICSNTEKVDRIVQLSQKTNQFNFMYSRFNYSEIQNFINDSKFTIYLASVEDNVGDSGNVLLLVTEKESDNPSSIRIIEFVLSCRMFGRGIAERTLSFIINHLYEIGITQIYCIFKKTQKNLQFENFLPSMNFQLLSEQNNNFYYEYDTLKQVLKIDDYSYIEVSLK